MTKPVYQKMGIKAGESVAFVNSPSDVIVAVMFPGIINDESPDATVDHLIICCITQQQMQDTFQSAQQRIRPAGKLWLTWPKGKRLGSDLSVPAVIKIGYDFGMVESTNLSVSETWTALKFTWPKPGKTYNNSYGTLPSN